MTNNWNWSLFIGSQLTEKPAFLNWFSFSDTFIINNKNHLCAHSLIPNKCRLAQQHTLIIILILRVALHNNWKFWVSAQLCTHFWLSLQWVCREFHLVYVQSTNSVRSQKSSRFYMIKSYYREHTYVKIVNLLSIILFLSFPKSKGGQTTWVELSWSKFYRLQGTVGLLQQQPK